MKSLLTHLIPASLLLTGTLLGGLLLVRVQLGASTTPSLVVRQTLLARPSLPPAAAPAPSAPATR